MGLEPSFKGDDPEDIQVGQRRVLLGGEYLGKEGW
jgi:hypothetical protein